MGPVPIPRCTRRGCAVHPPLIPLPAESTPAWQVLECPNCETRYRAVTAVGRRVATAPLMSLGLAFCTVVLGIHLPPGVEG